MAWYDYRCDDCGHEFEANRPIAERDLANCPQCRGRRTTRLIRPVGMVGGGGRGAGGGGSCGPARPGFS